MRKLLIILLILFSKNTFCQYIATFKTDSEYGVINYQLQHSKDLTQWDILETILPAKQDSNLYEIVVTDTGYYRVVQNSLENFKFFTKEIYLPDTTVLVINISNISVTDNVLKFTSANEDDNLFYYIIEQSVDGINFIQTQKIYAKGNSDYQINLK